jgi:hypothetical protein
MEKRANRPRSRGTAKLIRSRIAKGGDRVWRFSDFPNISPPALAQTLSRLTRQGELRRLSKGVYYRSRQTALGGSAPNPAALRRLVGPPNSVFPAGTSAANLLGFSTQAASRSEVATSAMSLPRRLVGADTIIHTRRPEAWTRLSASDAALLDFLRRGANTSDLSPQETVSRTVTLFRGLGRFERLLKAAHSEPPRVRALMGAIGEMLGKKPAALRRLRASLNPLSRFDFGLLSSLPSAGRWQAKARRSR